MSKLYLDFIDDYEGVYTKYEESYSKYFRKTLKLLKIKAKVIELEVRIVDEEVIQEINKTYRHKDAVTDVISFALNDKVEGEVIIKNAPLLTLGTILICAPKALQQALDYGHSQEREFNFLFVHGLLHLLGYDHMNEEDEKIMFDLQDKIIGKRTKE